MGKIDEHGDVIRGECGGVQGPPGRTLGQGPTKANGRQREVKLGHDLTGRSIAPAGRKHQCETPCGHLECGSCRRRNDVTVRHQRAVDVDGKQADRVAMVHGTQALAPGAMWYGNRHANG